MHVVTCCVVRSHFDLNLTEQCCKLYKRQHGLMLVDYIGYAYMHAKSTHYISMHAKSTHYISHVDTIYKIAAA